VTSISPDCIAAVPSLPPLQLDYTPGVNTTVAAFMAFQRALPTLDRRFGFTYGLDNAKFSLTVSGR